MILRLTAIVTAFAALSVSPSFGADITVGFVTSLSGPGASIGIPYEKGILAGHAMPRKSATTRSSSSGWTTPRTLRQRPVTPANSSKKKRSMC
jgi:hypothetical protein